MPCHPDPDKKLFGFTLTYATGSTDYGLVVATDAETARLHVEASTFAGIDVQITFDQPSYVDVLVDQYRGLAFLTTEPGCN